MLAALLVCAAFCSTPASASNNNNNDTLSVAMCGDIMMGTTFPSVQLPANDGADLFKDAGPVFRRADLAVGNLEGTLCDGGKSAKGEGPNVYSFRTPTTYVQWLKQAGFDFLSMANNHAHDFGEEGILSTERMLLQEDIKFAGIEGRTETAVVERKGLRIGLCAFGHNSYTLKHTDLSTVGRILADLKQRADLIIVSFHGGAKGAPRVTCPTELKHSSAKTAAPCVNWLISASTMVLTSSMATARTSSVPSRSTTTVSSPIASAISARPMA